MPIQTCGKSVSARRWKRCTEIGLLSGPTAVQALGRLGRLLPNLPPGPAMTKCVKPINNSATLRAKLSCSTNQNCPFGRLSTQSCYVAKWFDALCHRNCLRRPSTHLPTLISCIYCEPRDILSSFCLAPPPRRVHYPQPRPRPRPLLHRHCRPRDQQSLRPRPRPRRPRPAPPPPAETTPGTPRARVLHSLTAQLNLSCFGHTSLCPPLSLIDWGKIMHPTYPTKCAYVKPRSERV